jgi:hypothetical protein
LSGLREPRYFTVRTYREKIMKNNMNALAVSLVLLAAPQITLSHEGSAAQHKLGTVSFATSCNPAVQPQFSRAMALLHSFWANDAIKTFNAVLEQDPACAIAY